MIEIKEGQKCKYKPFGGWKDGTVCAVMDDGRFYVTDGAIKVAQYDDSLRDYKQEDIGRDVLF